MSQDLEDILRENDDGDIHNDSNIDIDMIIEENSDFDMNIDSSTIENKIPSAQPSLVAQPSPPVLSPPPQQPMPPMKLSPILPSNEPKILPPESDIQLTKEEKERMKDIFRENEEFENNNDNYDLEKILDEDIGFEFGSKSLSDDSDIEKFKKKNLPPLEKVDLEEREFQNDQENDFDCKFIFSNYRTGPLAKSINIQFQNQETITNKLFAPVVRKPTNAADDIGGPRCIVGYRHNIVVLGTSRGKICYFDLQNMKLSKFWNKNIDDYGSISCIDISPDGKYIIAGHEKGQLVLWDIQKGHVALSVFDQPACPLLFVKFLRSSFKLISSDMMGNVNIFTLSQGYFGISYEKQPLLTKETDKNGKPQPMAIYHSINFLKPNITKSQIDANKYFVIVLSGIDSFKVILIEPQLKILYALDSIGGQESFLLHASWGYGIYPENNENPNPLLLVSFGRRLLLISFSAIDLENTNHGFSFVGEYCLEKKITYSGWLNNSLIMTVDERKHIYTLFSGEFLKKIPDQSQMPGFQFNTAPIYGDSDLESGQEFSYQTYVKNPKTNNALPLYSNSIFIQEEYRKIHAFSFKSVFEAKLLSWGEYIESLKSQGEWMMAMNICLKIYRGELKHFAEIPHTTEEREIRLRPYFKELVSTYLSNIFSTAKETKMKDETVEVLILTAIDFLVSSKNFKYLFGEIFSYFQENSYQNKFFECLESFILKNKIKYVPSGVCRLITKFYVNKPIVLKHLIINLDLSLIDYGEVIQLCLDYKIYTALIYISVNNDSPDFFTPLVKIFAEVRDLTDTKKKKEDILYYAYRCLWYINMCLTGHLFPDRNIPRDLHENVVENIFVWMFVEENLKYLLLADAKICFEIVFKFFNEPIFKIISGRAPKLFKNKKAEEVIIDVCTSVVQKYERELNHEYMILMAKIINIDSIKIPLSTVHQVLMYFLEEKYFSFEQGDCFDDEFDNTAYNDKSGMIIRLLNHHIEHFDEKFDTLMEFAKKSPYLEVYSDFLCYSGSIEEAFDRFFRIKSRFIQLKIFDFIKKWMNFFTERSQQGNLEKLTNKVIEAISVLKKINCNQTQEILRLYTSNSDLKVLSLLKDDPKFLLEYLLKIMHEKKNEKIQDEILILHLDLLAKIDPSKVFKYLKTYHYPLDEAIKICSKNKIKDALAFLYQRSGLITEALNLYLEVLKELLQSEIKSKTKKKMLDAFDGAFCLCKSNSKKDDLETEMLWFILLEKVFKIQHEIVDKIVIDEFSRYRKDVINIKEEFNNILASTFEEIIQYVRLEALVDKLQIYYGSLKLVDMKKSLLNMLTTYAYEEQIYKDSEAIILSDLQKANSKFTHSRQSGLRANGNCSLCNCSNNQLDLKIYSCGHFMHYDCLVNFGYDECSTCLEENKLFNLIFKKTHIKREKSFGNPYHYEDEFSSGRRSIEATKVKSEILEDSIDKENVDSVKSSTSRHKKIKIKNYLQCDEQLIDYQNEIYCIEDRYY